MKDAAQKQGKPQELGSHNQARAQLSNDSGERLLSVEDNGRPNLSAARKKYSIKVLTTRMPEDYCVAESSFGRAVGAEER